MSAGKGDRPRNCGTKQFNDNFTSINWGTPWELVPPKARAPKESIMPKFGRWYWWASVCSEHQGFEPGCTRCAMGTWTEKVMT